MSSLSLAASPTLNLVLISGLLCQGLKKCPGSLSLISHCPLEFPEHQSSGQLFVRRNLQLPLPPLSAFSHLFGNSLPSCFGVMPDTKRGINKHVLNKWMTEQTNLTWDLGKLYIGPALCT